MNYAISNNGLKYNYLLKYILYCLQTFLYKIETLAVRKRTISF